MPRPWCLDKQPAALPRRPLAPLPRHPTHPVSIANITAAARWRRTTCTSRSLRSASSVCRPLAPAPARSASRTVRSGFANVNSQAIQKHSAPDIDFMLNRWTPRRQRPAFNRAGHHQQWSVGGEVDGLDRSSSRATRIRGAFRRRRPSRASSGPRRSIAASNSTPAARTSPRAGRATATPHRPVAHVPGRARRRDHGMAAAIRRQPSVLKRFRAAPKTLPTYTSRYKYIVDVDGNVQSNRFRHIMTQGAIVLRRLTSSRPTLRRCTRFHT